jgi:RNA polymerase sigma-70 factor (ECF subfamily)
MCEEELIKEIKTGSQAAMEVLVKRYYKIIYSYIYRNIGDRHTAGDITQEVFIKMMKNIREYRDIGRFKNWLFKIAVNTLYDYYRGSTYRNIKNQAPLDDEIACEDNVVWDMVSRNIERKRVKEAVMELPDYQRDALVLRFYHDMRVKDIAALTGCGEATVKSRLKQGMDKLKRILCGGEKFEYGEKKF